MEKEVNSFIQSGQHANDFAIKINASSKHLKIVYQLFRRKKTFNGMVLEEF